MAPLSSQPHLCFCPPHQAEDGVSMLVVSGGDGICVRPRVWFGVHGQLHLQRPEQQGKDTGRSNCPLHHLRCLSIPSLPSLGKARQLYLYERFLTG